MIVFPSWYVWQYFKLSKKTNADVIWSTTVKNSCENHHLDAVLPTASSVQCNQLLTVAVVILLTSGYSCHHIQLILAITMK